MVHVPWSGTWLINGLFCADTHIAAGMAGTHGYGYHRLKKTTLTSRISAERQVLTTPRAKCQSRNIYPTTEIKVLECSTFQKQYQSREYVTLCQSLGLALTGIEFTT